MWGASTHTKKNYTDRHTPTHTPILVGHTAYTRICYVNTR